MSEARESVSKEELIMELRGELHYHSDGGTSYRRETADFALQIAEQVSDITVFFDRGKTYTLVAEFLKNSDEYRLRDVSKMLSVIIRDLERQKRLPKDVKAYAETKMKDWKSLKFK